MKKLIALLLATLMVCTAFAGCGSKEAPAADPTTAPTTAAPTDPVDEPTDPVDEPTDPVDEPTDPVDEPTDPDINLDIDIDEPATNLSYDEIFSQYNIVDMPALFVGMDSMSFAMDSEGMVEKIELGYKDEVVCEMVNVVYYPTEGMTDEDKTLLDTTMQEVMAAYTDLECCSNSSFTMSENYYIISLTFSNLDNADNVATLEELGLIEADGSGLCSITASEASLTANGYTKK